MARKQAYRRYYSEWTSVEEANGISPGWQLFDREYCNPQGAPLPFAWACTQRDALLIAKALNAFILFKEVYDAERR